MKNVSLGEESEIVKHSHEEVVTKPNEAAGRNMGHTQMDRNRRVERREGLMLHLPRKPLTLVSLHRLHSICLHFLIVQDGKRRLSVIFILRRPGVHSFSGHLLSAALLI